MTGLSPASLQLGAEPDLRTTVPFLEPGAHQPHSATYLQALTETLPFSSESELRIPGPPVYFSLIFAMGIWLSSWKHHRSLLLLDPPGVLTCCPHSDLPVPISYTLAFPAQILTGSCLSSLCPVNCSYLYSLVSDFPCVLSHGSKRSC